MQFFHDILTSTIPTTTGLFEAYDLVSFAGAKVTVADAPVAGIAKHPNTVIGDPAAVMNIGLARVRAVGAITAGARVVSAAAGGVQVAGATPANVLGRAQTTAADGEFVTILFACI